MVEGGHRLVEPVPVVEVGEAASLEGLDWVEEADMSGLESGDEFRAPENRYSSAGEDGVVRLLAACQGSRGAAAVRATAKELIDKMVAANHLERREEFLSLPESGAQVLRAADRRPPGFRPRAVHLRTG